RAPEEHHSRAPRADSGGQGPARGARRRAEGATQRAPCNPSGPPTGTARRDDDRQSWQAEGDVSMTALEDAVGRRLQLPGHFVQPVLVEAADPFDSLVLLRVRTSEGQLREATISPDELDAALATAVPTTRQTVSPDEFFLLVESSRIRLAFAHDPHFAVAL